jgi:hypothetical protein
LGPAEEPRLYRWGTAEVPQGNRLDAGGRGSKTAAPKIVPPGRSSVRMGLTIRDGLEIARTAATVDRVFL